LAGTAKKGGGSTYKKQQDLKEKVGDEAEDGDAAEDADASEDGDKDVDTGEEDNGDVCMIHT
jgi:hypothetical protein